jgi:hypothetical protein
MSATFPRKAANFIAATNAHCVAPALGGMGVVYCVRRYITKAENPASAGGLISGAVGGLATNAAVHLGANWYEARSLGLAVSEVSG